MSLIQGFTRFSEFASLLNFEEIDHTPTGSMTLENEMENVRREADLSYEIEGNPETRSLNIPDLAIEIVVTSGGLNTLAAYGTGSAWWDSRTLIEKGL